MSWLRKQYPVGKEFDAPDPDTGQPVPVTVTGYWKNSVSRDTGIEVQTGDGRAFNISTGYLWEDGSGTYDPPRGPGRPRFDPAAPTVRTTVRLTNAQAAKAKALGDGHVAQGVRNALEAA